jgi:hypothetical protein
LPALRMRADSTFGASMSTTPSSPALPSVLIVSPALADANNLVGRIAFDSFHRVRQQFYDLVLKANVGTVDVAFTRKQDKTVEIQKLSAQKDRELRALDRDFKEVLKEID